MKIVDRHLAREFIQPLVFCLLGFLMIFTVADLFDHLNDFLRLEIGLPAIISYYLCLLPTIAEFITPVSLLLATLFTLSSLTRHNELTAMRSCGFSLYRLMIPFLAIGLLCALVTAIVMETVGPRALEYTAQFISSREEDADKESIHQDVAYYNRHDRYLWWIEQIDVRTPETLIGISVKFENPDGTERRVVSAERADWMDGAWWLQGAVVERPATNAAQHARKSIKSAYNRPTEWRELTEAPEDIAVDLKPWEFLTSYEMHRYVDRHHDLPSPEITRKEVDLHRRLAMPWTCFIAILFGIPAGARTGREGALMGVLFALAFFFGYYALMQVGLFLGIQELLPPWAGAWLPNFIFLGIGLIMTIRMR